MSDDNPDKPDKPLEVTWGDDVPPPRKPSWGCLAAAIIASGASVIALIIVIKVILAVLLP